MSITLDVMFCAWSSHRLTCNCSRPYLLAAQSTYNAPYVYCEYAFHGVQSRYTCCPLGLTGRRNLPDTCGCRDDIDQTPYRMGAVIAAPPSPASTTFAFNLALVETQWRQDFDGLDYDQGLAVGVGRGGGRRGLGVREAKNFPAERTQHHV